ncbi:transposase [Deinococcus sp. RIT780]|uniref:transposase n=1 Tax=Deinococcus sp. RIT780 TaxID=2870472 RepID=UPI001C896454|nr:transposase [Deinococcus sp. RIT780]MBX8463559.1 transposase [Deinococcus sp. RIT780]
MNPKNARARRLYSDILTCFSRKQHRDSFQVFLYLLLDGSGRPLPTRATVKSPSAISRFLNHTSWDLRTLCRFMRQAALQLFNDTWKHAPHQRPWVEFLVDLTSLEKAGKFSGLSDWMHVLNAVNGVHLVVLYIKSFHFPADVVSRGVKQGSVLLKVGQDVLLGMLSCLPLCGPPRHARSFPTHP